MGLDGSVHQAEQERLAGNSPNSCEFSDSRNWATIGPPVGNPKPHGNLVVIRALEDEAISDETSQEKVVSGADDKADGERGPGGILAQK